MNLKNDNDILRCLLFPEKPKVSFSMISHMSDSVLLLGFIQENDRVRQSKYETERLLKEMFLKCKVTEKKRNHKMHKSIRHSFFTDCSFLKFVTERQVIIVFIYFPYLQSV